MKTGRRDAAPGPSLIVQTRPALIDEKRKASITVRMSELLRDRSCVFCGNPPIKRNREHVIPQWLIELTGDARREWQLGMQFVEGSGEYRERKYSANQFKFPACARCNGNYSALETRAKDYMLRIQSKQPLTASDWDDFLTWFDKVRVGLWLGWRMLNRELPHQSANFQIDQRIGKKDRCVLVYRINPHYRGLHMLGAGDLIFFMWPFCFALIVNELFFINVSSDFILSSRMGFPFFKKIVDNFPVIKCSDLECFYRQKVPFLRFDFPIPIIEVYQTVLLDEDFTVGQIYEYRKLADHPLIRSKLIPGSGTRSLIHSVQDGRSISFLPDEPILERQLPHYGHRHGLEYLKRMLEFRHKVFSSKAGSNHWTKLALFQNHKAIEYYSSELKEHDR